MSALRAVTFDLYGTLVDIDSLRIAVSARTADATAFVEAWRAKQLQYAFLATMMDRYADFDTITGSALDYACAQFDVALDAPARAQLVGAWSQLPTYPEVPATLAALRARGLRLAILSNGTPKALARTVAAAGIAEAFETLLSVDVVRAYKPRPEVYHLAVEQFGLTRDEIGFVSANGWDAMGAAEFGFRVFWCNRRRLPSETFGAKPSAEIASLTELLES